MSTHLFIYSVEVTGLEPATAWSQTRNATNCATPRFSGCKVTKFFCTLQIKPQLFNDSLLYENLLQGFNGTVNLLVGMRSHQSKAYERILRCTSRRNNGIDENTCLESKRRDKEGLINIAHIKGNNCGVPP